MLHFLGGKSAMHFYCRVQKLVYLYEALPCFLLGHAFGHSPEITIPSPPPPTPTSLLFADRPSCGQLKPIFLFS